MKYKKQIAMICLITFLFLPFQKYEEPKAEILTLTTGAIIACAALATAAGVIITNPHMLQDVGERIYEGIRDIDGAIEKVGDKVKINVTKGLIKAVVGVCSSLPKIEEYKNKIYDYLSPTIMIKSYSFEEYNSTYGSVTLKSRYDKCNLDFYFNNSSKSYYMGSKYLNKGEQVTLQYSLIGNNFYAYLDGVKTVQTNSLNRPSKVWGYFTFNDYMDVVSADYGESVCIPYTEENSKNVSADKPLAYFPTGSGSISVPIDTPLSNYNPSVDNPISLPTDLVGDGISADVDTSTDTGAIDKPNVDVGETPTTGESLWDTLLSWLSSLFAPLVALLEWIGSILTSILEFLGSLVSSLVDAIVSLFVPTVAVDELFSIPEGSGFSDILSLFDWGLFDIEPKPYEFVATLDFISLVDNTSNPQVIEIKLFDNELVKKYLPYVRNILSYSLLISTISMIVWHFIPKRDID